MGTTSSMLYAGNIYKNMLLYLAKDIVWKNQTEADQYEENCDPYEVDLFMAANRGMLNFNVVKGFDEGTLRTIPELHSRPQSEIDSMVANKNLIPVAYRQRVVDSYTTRICSVNMLTNRLGILRTEKDPVTGEIVTITEPALYEEKNDYIRLLNGLPPYDLPKEKYFYNMTDGKISYALWPKDVPIHELSFAACTRLETSGILKTLVDENPDKPYLKFLAKKRVSFFVARAAERFDILWMNTTEDGKFREDFRDVYNQNKYMVTSVYYSPAYKRSNDLYENFLALCLVFMTVQIMNYKYLSVDVTRDFYDTESLRYIYDSYGVPFYSEIPLEYHKRITKKINRLISYKGSNQVFFDLFDLFDMGSMDIYSYYLTKKHKLNADGLPIFEYNSDGTVNKASSYLVNFSKVKVGSDPALATSDTANEIPYHEMIASDPYWIDDLDLQKKLFEDDYNYTETKYIGIQSVFDVLRQTYENAYFFKIIQDNKDILDTAMIKWDVTNTKVSLFDFFVYLSALYCKKYGYEGNISSELPFVSTVLGYNFKDNVKILQEQIMKDARLFNDPNIVTVVANMNVDNFASVNAAFVRINELGKYLIAKYSAAKTREEYYVYKHLYDTLMTSKLMESSFQKNDGTVAVSFQDLLDDTAPVLYARLTTLEYESSINDEIRLVITLLEKLLPNVKFLDAAMGLDTNSLIESLFKILTFFKSAKAELVGYNLVYVMSMRGVNFFKLMDEVVSEEYSDIHLNDEAFLAEYINYMMETARLRNDMIWKLSDETVSSYAKSVLRDYIEKLTDDMRVFYSSLQEPFKENVEYQDVVESTQMVVQLMSLLRMGDSHYVIREEFLEPKYKARIKDCFDVLTDCLMDKDDETEYPEPVRILWEYIDEWFGLEDSGMRSDSKFPFEDALLHEFAQRHIHTKLTEWMMREITKHFILHHRSIFPFLDRLVVQILKVIIKDRQQLTDLLKTFSTAEYWSQLHLSDQLHWPPRYDGYIHTVFQKLSDLEQYWTTEANMSLEEILIYFIDDCKVVSNQFRREFSVMPFRDALFGLDE